jgi:hypothetical protein
MSHDADGYATAKSSLTLATDEQKSSQTTIRGDRAKPRDSQGERYKEGSGAWHGSSRRHIPSTRTNAVRARLFLGLSPQSLGFSARLMGSVVSSVGSVDSASAGKRD